MSEKIKVSGVVKYVKWTDKKAGDTLVVGEYLGEIEVPKYKGKAGETTPAHKFKLEDGSLAQLGSAGQLNFLLRQTKELLISRQLDGDVPCLVEVIFLGKDKYIDKKTKKVEEANQFEVNLIPITSEE